MKKILLIISLMICGYANAETSEILPPDLKLWIGRGLAYDKFGQPMTCPYWEEFDTFRNVTCGGIANNKWKNINDYHPLKRSVYGYKLVLSGVGGTYQNIIVYWK